MASNLAIFASGSGTNAEAIIEFFQNDGSINVSLVVASKSTAGVIQRAERLGVEWVVVSQVVIDDEEAMLALLDGFEIDYIILAGWMKLIPAYLTKAFDGKMLNIHPALLPKFGGKGMYGANVHKAVYEAGEKESGITIHQVNAQYDEGEIIAQFRVPLAEDDDAASIEQKVRALELKHYPATIKKFILS